MKLLVLSLLSLLSLNNSYALPDSEQVDSERAQAGHKHLSPEAQRFLDFLRAHPPTRNMTIYSNYSAFFYGAVQSVGDRPFSISQHVGFSGAGYADANGFRDRFKASLIDQLNKTPKGGVAIVVLGGSTDGIGAAYDVIQQYREGTSVLREGKLGSMILGTGQELAGKELRVIGMVSSQVVAYHLEGFEKNWGESISTKQDAILLLDTPKDSWEMKEASGSTSRTVDIALSASNLRSCVGTSFHVWEGGDQALRETFELVARSEQAAQDGRGRFELVLETGLEPGKPKKDKGYRAASQAAYSVGQKAKSISLGNVTLSVNTPNEGSSLPLDSYLEKTAAGAALSTEMTRETATAEASIAERIASAAGDQKLVDTLEAEKRKVQAYTKTNEVFVSTAVEVVHQHERAMEETRRSPPPELSVWHDAWMKHALDQSAALEKLKDVHQRLARAVEIEKNAAIERAKPKK